MKSKKAYTAIIFLLAFSLALLSGCDITPVHSSSVSAAAASSDTMVVIPQSEYQQFYDYYLSRWTLYDPAQDTYHFSGG